MDHPTNSPSLKEQKLPKQKFGLLTKQNFYRELTAAFKQNDKEKIKEITQKNLQDEAGNTDLMLAIEKGDYNIAEALVKVKAKDNLNLQNEAGNTALILAAEKGLDNVVQALIKAGANLNLHNKYNLSTALMRAAQQGHINIVGFLIEARAKINLQPGKARSTALMLASRKGHKNIVRMLINAGAKVDLQDYNKLTALTIATMQGHTKVMKILINAKADLNLKDTWNLRPFLHAVRGKKIEAMKLLIRSGADIRRELGKIISIDKNVMPKEMQLILKNALKPKEFLIQSIIKQNLSNVKLALELVENPAEIMYLGWLRNDQTPIELAQDQLKKLQKSSNSTIESKKNASKIIELIRQEINKRNECDAKQACDQIVNQEEIKQCSTQVNTNRSSQSPENCQSKKGWTVRPFTIKPLPGDSNLQTHLPPL